VFRFGVAHTAPATSGAPMDTNTVDYLPSSVLPKYSLDRSVLWLSEHGIPAGKIRALDASGLKTIADIVAYLVAGDDLCGVPGIGGAFAEHICRVVQLMSDQVNAMFAYREALVNRGHYRPSPKNNIRYRRMLVCLDMRARNEGTTIFALMADGVVLPCSCLGCLPERPLSPVDRLRARVARAHAMRDLDLY